jgi:hypothetical protein
VDAVTEAEPGVGGKGTFVLVGGFFADAEGEVDDVDGTAPFV